MKLSFLRQPLLLALVLTLGLAACGGKASFEVKGTVQGVNYPGLVLTNNGGGDLAVPAGATTFAFPGSIEYGTAYNVDFKSFPLHSTCTRGNAADTAGRQASINVEIACGLVPHTLGGTITGLTADGLELINGSNDKVAPAKDATAYVMTGQIPFGTTYGVTVLKNPTGLKCTVANGVGVMGDDNLGNINVTCVAG